MATLAPALDQLTLDLTEEILVHAPIATTFDALLEELGPSNLGHADAPMPMRLEAFPGGRWYRDLGDGNGHFWGVVQAIKRPSLLEMTGPMMMSFAVASNVQYRLKEVDGGTLITLHHSALGLFPDGYRMPLTTGWKKIFERVRVRAEQTSR
jgi:uncharacterized protein YndB with AHSA1/START domain